MTKKGENNTLTKAVVFEDEMFLEIKEMMKASGNGFSFVINEVLEKGLLNIEYDKVAELNKNLNEEIEWKNVEIINLKSTLKSIENLLIKKEENGNN